MPASRSWPSRPSDEETAASAIEAIQVDLEPLPFVVDPLDSLRPGGPNARLNGNVWGAPRPPAPGAQGPAPAPVPETVKWSAADFADDEGDPGRLPMGKALEEWSFGDLDAGFKNAELVLDESFIVQSTSHHPMETRSAMAYWQNGKLYLHASTQSVAFTVAGIARWVGIPPSDVVLICEYTGGGFGSKGAGAVSSAIPALLAKKANAPVMMRISREEESYIGRARTNMSGRARVGFAKDGRITALDLFIVQDSGAYGPMGDHQIRGQRRLVDLSARRDALAGDQRDHQHAAANAAAVAGPDAGQRHHRADRHQGREAARSRSGGDPPHQRPEGQGRLRPARPERCASARDQRVRHRSARQGRAGLQLGGAQGAQRAAAGQQGARHRCDCRPARSRIDRLGRHHDAASRRQAVRPIGRRQSRHALGVRSRARRRRRAGDALGEGRGRVGQHRQTPAVDVPLGRQPDDARDDARQPRGRAGREEEAAGDRRDGSRRLA